MPNHPPSRPRLLSELTCRFLCTNRGQLYAQRTENPSAPHWPVPCVPKCLVEFVAHLGALFYQQENRCLSALLQLDPERAHWSFILPPQTCFPNHSTWALKSEDLHDFPPAHVIAGSIQVIAGEDEDLRVEEICSFDGVHFVIRLRDGGFNVALLVVAGGNPLKLPIESVLHDQIEAAIQQAVPDLTAPLTPAE